MDETKISILIVGASGNLGSLVTKHALNQSNLIVNVLVRNPDKIKDLISQIEKAGGKVIQADLSKPETLKDVTKGIHTVISCISVKQETDIQLQDNLLENAVKNEVTRFFPSHYGVNYDNAAPDNKLIGTKLKFIEHLSKTEIKPVVITSGFILECYLEVNKEGLHYYGDVNQKIDLTSYDDVAKFIIAVAKESERSGKLRLIGMELSTKEIEEIYNKVRGTSIEAKRTGSVDDLRREAEQKKKEGAKDAVLVDVLHLIYSGKAKVENNDSKEFSSVEPISLEEYLRKNPEKNMK